MSRSQWPDSTNSPSEIPGTIHFFMAAPCWRAYCPGLVTTRVPRAVEEPPLSNFNSQWDIPGITVTYETIRQWCQTFGLDYARRLRRGRGRLGDTWYLDELFVTIQGRRQYLWRAVDQDGDVIDILPAVATQSPRGRALLSQVVEGTRSGAPPAGHGQAAELRGGAAHGHARSDAQHAAIREQSGGRVAPTDPAT